MRRLRHIAEVDQQLLTDVINYICENCIFEKPEEEKYNGAQDIHYLCRASIAQESVDQQFPQLANVDHEELTQALRDASKNYQSYPSFVDVVEELKSDADAEFHLQNSKLESYVEIHIFDGKYVVDCGVEAEQNGEQAAE